MRLDRDLQTALNDTAASWDTSRQETIHGITGSCPHCGVVCALEQLSVQPLNASIGPGSDDDRLLMQGRCPACKNLVVVASRYFKSATGSANVRLDLLWPSPIRASRAPADLEDGPRKDYDEARRVLVASPTGAAALTRRCLQHVIRHKLTIQRKTLFDEIQAALADDRLSRFTKNALDHVREIGNLAAHPEVDQAQVVVTVSLAEANYTLDVLELLFTDLYDTPAKVDAMDRMIQAR